MRVNIMKIFAIEGLDRVGKTTIIKLIREMDDNNLIVDHSTAEVRKLIEEAIPSSEIVKFLKALREDISSTEIPEGKCIVMDRNYLTTLVYGNYFNETSVMYIPEDLSFLVRNVIIFNLVNKNYKDIDTMYKLSNFKADNVDSYETKFLSKTTYIRFQHEFNDMSKKYKFTVNLLYNINLFKDGELRSCQDIANEIYDNIREIMKKGR